MGRSASAFLAVMSLGHMVLKGLLCPPKGTEVPGSLKFIHSTNNIGHLPDTVPGTGHLVEHKGSPGPCSQEGRLTVYEHTQMDRIISDSDKYYEGKHLKR